MSSDVQNFYAGKTIFITGATGFLGQVLLSKLLCSCPELFRIYLLIREKHGKSAHQRLKEILDSSIFNRAKELHPNYATKIRSIRGNLDETDLGISDSDREMIENEVEIIFHVAASVKFNTALRKATYANVHSVNVMLKISKKSIHLKAFVYVSTAFTSSSETKLIQEKFYDPPLSPRNLFRLVEHMNDEDLNEITPRLIKPFPNTYVFTKLIAEDLCREEGSNLPMCIFRPAIITSCFREPVSGWINNFYGPIGIVFQHSLGILKYAPVDSTKIAPIVPADYAANALILAAYFTSTLWGRRSNEKKFDIPVINYSSCTTKLKITWGIFLNEYNKALGKYPFYNMVTLPNVKFISNLKLYRFSIIIFHFFPAFVIDLALIVIGKTPRVKTLYRKIHKSLDLLPFFSTQEWTIFLHNIYKIRAQLSEKDREIFYCDLSDLNIEQYFETLERGVRLYMAKDTDATIQKAVEKRKRLLVLYYVFSTIFILIFLFLLIKCFNFIPFAYF